MTIIEYSNYTGHRQGDCGCGGSPCTPAEAGGLARTRFFQGQLVMPDDLTQDQIYFRDKHLRHNRMLHGWGVVCGARVMKHATEKCVVTIEPGYILGPYGHEIVINSEVEVDICKEGIDGNAVSPCSGAPDPWCADIRVNRPAGQPLYIAIAFSECESRPVRAQGHGCGCGESECEYSRIQDSFAIKVLTSLPSSYSDPMPVPNLMSAFRCATDANRNALARACPPCPPEPWVILADVVMADDGSIKDVDCFAHRRYVASFADFYFLCNPKAAGYDAIRESVYIDRAQTMQPGVAVAPKALVRTFKADGTETFIPLHWEVTPGETLAAMLAREGSREFLDPETNETFTLADAYAMAGVNMSATVRNVVDAGSYLDGVTIRKRDLNRTREGLRTVLDNRGTTELASRHGDAPAAVETLPGTALRGVGPRSALGRKVAAMTVGEIAGTDRAAFIARMSQGVAANQRTALTEQAGATWDAAAAAMETTREWRR